MNCEFAAVRGVFADVFGFVRLSAFLTLGPLLIAGASAQETSEPAAPARPPIEFQVLEQRKIDLGNRSLIFNRVVPPVLPLPPAPPPPPTAEEVAAAEAAAAALEGSAKRFEMLFLSTTVYDRKVTQVRWLGAGGREYRVFSNIDFNFLAGIGQIETDDAIYLLVLGLGNETTEQVEAFNAYARAQGWPEESWKEIPRPESFSQTRSEYAVSGDKAHPPPEEDLIALDALHVYYDANKQRLADEYARREVERVERELWLKEHPPVPKDTVINFWIEQPARAVRPE